MKKRNKIKCIFLLNLMVIFLLGFCTKAEASISKIPGTAQIEEVVSSRYLQSEYYKVRTPLDEDHVIYVEGKTKVNTKRFAIRVFKHGDSSKYYITVFVTPNSNGEFAVKINTKKGNSKDAIAMKGTVVTKKNTYGSCPGYKSVQKISAGYYHLTIARAITTADADVAKGRAWYNGPLGGSSGYCYKEALLQVKSGEENNLKLVGYPDIIENNASLAELYDVNGTTDNVYLDEYLDDLNYMFVNPKTGISTKMTESRVKYIKKVAEKVTKGAENDYEKLLKIYEYVTEKVYYDQLAYDQKKYQYANPYLNIYNMEEKISSDNSVNGKVSTTCQGYASMVILLARVEGIPARIVNGSHISYPLSIWSDKKLSQITSVTHWWAEAYVNDRWIVIDANAGTGNKWLRTGFSEKGTWRKQGITSYIGFDTDREQLSNCYSYITIKEGSTTSRFKDAREKQKLASFLETAYSGIKNGTKLNSQYTVKNEQTWGNGKTDNLALSSSGHVTKISWPKTSLYGKADFSQFNKLTSITLYSNRLTSLQVEGCPKLKYISANYNNLVSFDGTGAPNLKTIRLKGNKLTSCKFYVGSKKTIISRKNSVGSFGILYDGSTKKITICAESKNIPKNYKYLKIYRGSKLIKTINVSKRKSYTYTFTATSSTYSVKYTKK